MGIEQFVVSTVESVFDRWGAYHPVFSGVGVGQHMERFSFFDAIVSQQFDRNQLPWLAGLQRGDVLNIFLPDNTQPYVISGLHPLGQVLSIASFVEPSVVSAVPHCPICHYQMTCDTMLWCSNNMCRGRLVARMFHAASPEGLNYPHLRNRLLLEHLFDNCRFRDLAPFFDANELSIISPEVLPESMVREMLSWHRCFTSYMAASADMAALTIGSLLMGLSYPGIDLQRLPVLMRNAFQIGPNPLGVIADAFQDTNLLSYLLGEKQVSEGTRHMSRELFPFRNEFCRIVYATQPDTDEAGR